MDGRLSELIKELLVIIDELRVIDSPETVSRLQAEGVNDGLMYTADFISTYEAIRQRMEELGELPSHLDEGLWRMIEPMKEPIAWVELHQGRYWLVVRKLYVAMEGDKLHDPDIFDDLEMPNRWGEKGLRQAARIINGKEELER